MGLVWTGLKISIKKIKGTLLNNKFNIKKVLSLVDMLTNEEIFNLSMYLNICKCLQFPPRPCLWSSLQKGRRGSLPQLKLQWKRACPNRTAMATISRSSPLITSAHHPRGPCLKHCPGAASKGRERKCTRVRNSLN